MEDEKREDRLMVDEGLEWRRRTDGGRRRNTTTEDGMLIAKFCRLEDLRST
jgi:hypothetical protein